ncbi:unnamed protein product [Closterium sp. NIES-54]
MGGISASRLHRDTRRRQARLTAAPAGSHAPNVRAFEQRSRHGRRGASAHPSTPCSSLWQLDVLEDQPRDLRNETLIVRDDGNTFRIIPKERKRSADDVIQEVHWKRTRESMENYLRGFRDFQKSNWF